MAKNIGLNTKKLNYAKRMARNSGQRNGACLGLPGNMAAIHSKETYSRNKQMKIERHLVYREQVP